MIKIFDILYDSSQFQLNITINWRVFIIIGTVWILAILIKNVALKKSISIDAATLGIGNSNITIKYNRKDQEIAYKLWVELSTRKIGIPYDEENDLIHEVYNSWYEFFSIARELLKEFPVGKLAYSHELVDITQRILNDGLRPHLTTWQARYRKWYANNESEGDEAPQKIQRTYPDYALLIKDLIKTNNQMIEYKNMLYTIAFKKN